MIFLLLFIRIPLYSLNNFINTYKIKIKITNSQMYTFYGISRKQWNR